MVIRVIQVILVFQVIVVTLAIRGILATVV